MRASETLAFDPREVGHVVHCSTEARKQVETRGALVGIGVVHGHLVEEPVDRRAQKLFELVRDCGTELGLTIDWQATGGVCDGNNIAACGVPVVDTMGVRGGKIHSPDEFMIVSSLSERAALSALVLDRLARGEEL